MEKSSLYLEELPKILKRIILLFLVTISIGYGFGLRYLFITTEATPTVLKEQYLGNEMNEDAEVMKFKKTEKGILTFLHDHLMALGILQLILSLLIYFTKTNQKLKSFLVLEPFISLIITFCCIYLMWSGLDHLSYLIMITGTLFHLTFMFSLVLLGVKMVN